VGGGGVVGWGGGGGGVGCRGGRGVVISVAWGGLVKKCAPLATFEPQGPERASAAGGGFWRATPLEEVGG